MINELYIKESGLYFPYRGKLIDLSYFLECAINGVEPDMECDKVLEMDECRNGDSHMKIIARNRQTGKTTQLIYTSEATGYPIVTHTRTQVDYIKKLADKCGCKIPNPVTIQEMRGDALRGYPDYNYDKVLIDNVEYILSDALSSYLGGREIVCCTMSI